MRAPWDGAPLAPAATRAADTGGHGTAPHRPVMLAEVMARLAPQPGETILDGTFGAGGYTRAILAAGARVLALDRDPDAIARGAALKAEAGEALVLVEGLFGDLDAHAAAAGAPALDGVVLDVGVSSPQLDEAHRGFSFRAAGPLDMRMGGDGPTAAEVIDRLSERDLSHVIRVLGEERHARRVARAVREARASGRLADTRALAETVAAVVPRSVDGIHPATRTFQALRLYVNRELEELGRALGAAERALAEGGRLVVVAFHSLEDRIVKRFLADRSATGAGGSRHRPVETRAEPTFSLLTRKAETPGAAEVAENPRARSARLRAAVRTAAPARPVDLAAIGVPALPALGHGGRS